VSAWHEREDPVEWFDQKDGGLVDCAENDLTEISQMAQKTDIIPCTLRIEALPKLRDTGKGSTGYRR